MKNVMIASKNAQLLRRTDGLMSEENKKKSHWMRIWRKDLDLTQKQAAALLGLKHRMIQNYEGGTHEVPRYVRLACYAVKKGVVDFGVDGKSKTKKLGKAANKIIESKTEK